MHEKLKRQSSNGDSSGERMKPESIREQAELIADLLESGYTLEQAKSQFASGLHPDDWAAIHEEATSRLSDKRSAANSSGARSHNPHDSLRAAAPGRATGLTSKPS